MTSSGRSEVPDLEAAILEIRRALTGCNSVRSRLPYKMA